MISEAYNYILWCCYCLYHRTLQWSFTDIGNARRVQMIDDFSISAHCYYYINKRGRDFFVGDIHGKYLLLMQALDKIHFDFSIDRLFSVGDVIDRGEASFNCLQLAKKSWFMPVIGNHEQFLLNTDSNDRAMKINWYLNGGSWWEELSDEERKLAREIVVTNYSLSLSVVTLGGIVGVIHAQYPFNKWPVNEADLNIDVYSELLWGRDYIKNNDEKFVEGIDFIVSGHTPITIPKLKCQQLFIDTGCGHQASAAMHDPHLTICEFQKNAIEIYAISEIMFTLSHMKIKF